MTEITVTTDEGVVVEVIKVEPDRKLSGVSLGALWMDVLEAIERARVIQEKEQDDREQGNR